METIAEVEISIEYTLNSGETEHVELLARDYFEPEALEDPEKLDVDAEPIYLDPVDYLEVSAADLASVKLLIRNKGSERSLSFNTSYWNGGKNQITAKTEWSEGTIVEEAVTFSVVTGDEPSVNHIVRTVAREGVLVPVYHRVFTAVDGGEEDEEEIL